MAVDQASTSRLLQRNAVLLATLCVLTVMFFQTTKHQPPFAAVNPFAEDPYDSVSSFGVQFVVFITLLSIVRVFRPQQSSLASQARPAMIVRTMLMGVMAALVISLSNGVALLRHRGLWRGVQGGSELATLSAAYLSIALLVGAVLALPLRSRVQPVQPFRWQGVAGAMCIVCLVLIFYPEHLRTQLGGELITVLAGAALLFLPVWTLATALSPPHEAAMDDFLADMAALYVACKDATPLLGSVWLHIEDLTATPWIQWLIELLNPRRHRWNVVVFLGVVIGGAFVIAEVSVDGRPNSLGRLITLATVFVGLQMAGIALGYALLSKPLHLVREQKSSLTRY